MDTNKNTDQLIPKRKKTIKIKIVLILLLVLVLLGFGIYGYSWLRSTKTMRLEANILIQDAERFSLLKGKIETEESRCKNFISQGEGGFSSFEYCKIFIDWANTTKNLQPEK